MSHIEIWDDSTLVDSWNEALEEYKHYHSIHARGEKVEEVLRSFGSHDKDSKEAFDMDNSAHQMEGVASNGIEGNQDEGGSTKDTSRDQQAESENKLAQGDETPRPKPSDGPGDSPQLVQHLIGSVPNIVHDEGLKSLLMSWYYAGYYTGLHEGRHQRR